MKNIKDYLLKQIRNAEDELDFCFERGTNEEVYLAESQLYELKNELTILEKIISEKEGNLIKFVNSTEFELVTIRTVNDCEIIERYDALITAEEYEDAIEQAKCLDISDTFSTNPICQSIYCVDDLSDAKTDRYYFVSNETLEEYVL